jgi:predicted dehydrogenase
MRVLIVGLGSIGRRHLKNLRAIEPTASICVWHSYRKEPERSDVSSYIDQEVFREDEALRLCADVALLTGPTSQHVRTAMALAERGTHLFIEKPLSCNLEHVDELVRLCHQRSQVLMVGYNFRFCKSLQVVKKELSRGRIGRPVALRAHVGQYLPDWRPGVDYRASVSASADLGGGAVLELSHEIDYLTWLGGTVKGVTAQIGHFSDLEMDVEDTAEIILSFATGALGSIHLNMVQRPAERNCTVIGTKGTLTWDGLSLGVQAFSHDSNTWTELFPANREDRNDMYMEEIRHFLGCVRGRTTPMVTGEDGKRIVEIALAAKEAARSQQTIYL